MCTLNIYQKIGYDFTRKMEEKGVKEICYKKSGKKALKAVAAKDQKYNA